MVQSPCLEGFLYLVVKGKTDKSVHTVLPEEQDN